MNRIPAQVASIDNREIVTYITLDVKGERVRLIMSRPPQWIEEGDRTYFTFQELSVCVGKSCEGKVSIENRLPATLEKMRMNHTMCELMFSSSIGQVVSLMTEKSFDELELHTGSEVMLLLRATDINLEPISDPLNRGSEIGFGIKVAN